MPDPSSDSDQQLDLKKRARRRLIGAAVFATVAAVVLPMVMDKEPPPVLPNIELRIPAQEKGFVAPAAKPAVPSVAEPVPAAPESAGAAVAKTDAAAVDVGAKAADKLAEKSTGKTAEPADKSPVAAKPAVKAEPKAVAKAKPEARPAAKDGEAKRAQAILDGRESKGSDGPHVVLIGAFANAGNVENLKKKLGELGIKVFTEPLDSPQGRKTRVRAGPFPNREAAEKAAARMKAIGVGGVVAAKS